MDRPQLQLINDDKEFRYSSYQGWQIIASAKMNAFVRDECGLRDKDYHLVAILGPQSSGKSTHALHDC